MAVSTNPLLFITECSKELTDEIADEKCSLDSCMAKIFQGFALAGLSFAVICTKMCSDKRILKISIRQAFDVKLSIYFKDYIESFENEEITIVTEIIEEYLLYLEEEDSLDVVRYNMKLLERKLENLEGDAKSNGWDSQKTKNVFQGYEKQLKRISKLVKKGRAENPGNDDYNELHHDYIELEKKCHHTKRSCTLI